MASAQEVVPAAARVRAARRLGASLPRWTWFLVSAAGWLVAWWLCARISGVPPELLPSPEAVAARIGRLAVSGIGDGPLWIHVGWSLLRFATGFLVAVVVAVPLGFAMSYFRPVDEAFTPLFEIFRCIPPIAWAPFSLLWFGATLGSQTFVIFTSAFPPILLSAYQGVKSTDPTLLNAARTLGARPLTVLAEVAAPASLPTLVTGLRIGLATGWMALVGAEIIAGSGSHAGLGYLILVGQQSLQANLTIGAMIVIGLVGATLDAAIRLIERRLTRWRTT